MKKELQDKIKSQYPDMFKLAVYSRPPTALGRGFECDDGWYSLIEKTCKRLADIKIDCVFTQIKEKLGGLTIYIDVADDKAWKILSEINRESFQTCEICGDVGKLCKKICNLKTLCSKHRQDLGYKVEPKGMITENVIWLKKVVRKDQLLIKKTKKRK